MSTFRTTQSWERGANNIASKDRVPEGFVRNAVNVDFLPGGAMALRAGYEQVYAGTAVRGVLALGKFLLIADGTNLVELNTESGVSRTLRTIAGAGPFVGDVLNEVLYFCTANECLQYDGSTVRPWGVPDVFYQPNVTASGSGGLIAGYYQVAVTYTDAWGLEGGTDRPAIIQAAANSALVVTIPTLPSGCTANIYVSFAEGETLYLQDVASAPGPVTIGLIRDDTARCTTILKRAPTPGAHVVAHNSILAVGVNNTVEMTMPMRPHLVDRISGFVQYGAPVGAMVSAGGLFVSADKCYALTNVETNGISQEVVLEFPAVPGTAVKLPDGRGAWMTRYGQAMLSGDGVQLVNRETFAPVKADNGAAGVLDENGNQLVVTTMQGANKPNPLAASDFFIGEIVNP